MASSEIRARERGAGGPQPTILKRWLHEPLLHFLLIGLGLFVVYGALGSDPGQGARLSRIEVTEDDLGQLQLAFAAQWRRPPSPEEMVGLVDSKIREEILYREALALGLDQGDTIVKRRLAQKMEFLAEDLAALREPNREELRIWFEKNAPRFTVPGRASFRHLYFSFDRRGERAREAAEGALAQLAGTPADASAVTMLADPFMFQDSYGDRSPEQVANVFGAQFTRVLFQLAPGAWQGPIASGFGWHLVWVDTITASRVPAFEEVESEVKAEWIAEQRAESRRRAFETMRARYEVLLPTAPAQDAVGAGVPPAKEAP